MNTRKQAILGVLLAAAAVLQSCHTIQGTIERSMMPSFYLNPPQSKDTFYGVGQAKMSTLDLSRTTAIARARDDVARQVQVSVKNSLTDYAQQAGEGENQQAVQFVESVSRQIADVTLSGCRTDTVEVTDDGTVYALVAYPVENLLQSAKTQFSRNEASAFAEFKAKEALERLQQEIQNNPPKR